MDWTIPCWQRSGLQRTPPVDSSGLEGEDFLVYRETKDGPWVFELPIQFVREISAIPESETLDVASRWAKQPELAHAGWGADDLAPAVTAIRDIASKATERNSALVLWMSL